MKIAIAGYGREGKANFEYFSSRGDITIVDERSEISDLPEGIPTILGEDAFRKLDGFDMVVRTAGLAPSKITTDGKQWSATNEFFEKCPAPIIGVTGSKGKGTTSSFAASILKAAGKTVHLVGNIGRPALGALPSISEDDVVVYELSSFQLWDLQKSPHIAVVLMIEPDHLDVHANMDEYVQAKQNIVKSQTSEDIVIFNGHNDYSRHIAESSAAAKIPVPSEQAAHIMDGYFRYGEQKICPVGSVKLPGVHNYNNACAAIDAAWQFTHDTEAIEAGLAAFEGLPHRLKLVRRVNDIEYYDDSIATTPGSVIAAMNAFDAPKVLILGGSSKGVDFTPLVDEAKKHAVKAIIAIGDEASKIERVFEGSGITLVNLGKTTTMTEIVSKASLQAAAGDVIILSPACASFDMFKNYSDRGDQFIAAVNSL